MILHIPHSHTEILDRNISQHDINRGTDWFTDELFWCKNADRIIQKHSRFIVDCERLPDNIEPMLKDGYGICYEKDFNGKTISVNNKLELMRIYEKHHTDLNMLANKQLCYFPVVFVVDCHSFGFEQNPADIDFCIGFNDDFVEFEMLEEIKNLLVSKNYKVGINKPYSNAIVPSQHYGNKLVKSIMIEVNKRLYLTDDLERSVDFEKTQNTITEILSIISDREYSDDFI